MFKKMFFLRKKFVKLLMIFSLISSIAISQTTNAKSIKIIATVNSVAITDYDVEEFSKIICFLSKKPIKECINSQDTMQMSLMTVIESELKNIHMQKMDVKDEMIDKKHFEEYKKSILGGRKLDKEISKEFFDAYFKTEYLWQMIIMSQAQEKKITKENLEEFAKLKNQKLTEKNRDAIYGMIMQQRANQINMDYMDRLKKFYLVDIKM